MKSYAEAHVAELPPMSFLSGTADARRAMLRQARAMAPFAKGGIDPIIVRHDLVTSLLKDKRLRGPGMDLARMSGIPEGSRSWRRQENILLFMEGDDHHRLRRLVSKAFTPRAVDGLRAYTRSVMRGLVDRVFDAGRCDAVPSLSNPYPIPVICGLVGIEPDRIDDMSRWATSALLALRLDAGQFLAEIEQAQAELDDYIDGLIAARRQSPRDDLLSRLIAVEEAGETLSRDELQAVVAMMLVAGTDTTRNQLSNMIHTFAHYPDAWAMVRERPEIVPNAVEEAIRWEPADARHSPDRARRHRGRRLRNSARVVRAADVAVGEPRRDGVARRRAVRRHARIAERLAVAHLRRRHPLLPRREPRPVGADRSVGRTLVALPHPAPRGRGGTQSARFRHRRLSIATDCVALMPRGPRVRAV
jgi:cytochrome P450